jgi:hypothetical protein
MRAATLTPARTVEGFEPGVLARIAEPGVALAVWRRAPDFGLAAWLDAVPPERLPRARIATPAAAAAEALAEACAPLPEGPERAALAADAARLAGLFADLVRADRLRLRFERVDTDSCRRFHVDRVAARLLCAYRGPGAEYGLADPSGAPQRIEQLGRFHAGVFRGLLWPGAEGLVHRSPPIEGTGAVRLILVVDAEHDDL